VEVDKDAEEEVDIEGIVGGLQSWYKDNIYLQPSYRHMMERQINFKELNKTERLHKYYPENQAFNHSSKMWESYSKRETAYFKAKQLETESHYKHEA